MSPEAALLKKWFPWTSEPLIVGAPMRTVSGPKLTAAVHAAGGLGMHILISLQIPHIQFQLVISFLFIALSLHNTNMSIIF